MASLATLKRLSRRWLYNTGNHLGCSREFLNNRHKFKSQPKYFRKWDFWGGVASSCWHTTYATKASLFKQPNLFMRIGTQKFALIMILMLCVWQLKLLPCEYNWAEQLAWLASLNNWLDRPGWTIKMTNRFDRWAWFIGFQSWVDSLS